MTQPEHAGAFIAIEGGDGSGKSRQVALLEERWQHLFPGVVPAFTKEPGGGSPYSLKIRKLALEDEGAATADPGALFGLMLASRFEHLGSFVLPHLSEGHAVISDRFEAATYAYQVVGQQAEYLRGLYHEHRQAIRMRLGAHAPHIILLDVDPETALARLASRKEAQGDQNHFDLRPLSFHEAVRNGLKEYASVIEPMTITIDGNPPVEEVHASVVAAVRSILEAA
ncbi:MAG: dTMP kinase [Patescibacteria group bacterium]